jgi:uncharacterized hydrophobic protein (TIGR00271 family)
MGLRQGDSDASPPADPSPTHRPWWQAWGRAIAEIGQVSPARRAAVLREIDEGSQPTATYYVLLGLSELIAGFALLVDSTATLIGANVVAPLMTPIFGAALGLMRGDLRLLRKALLAELGGAALGVALCYGLGLLPLMGEPSATLLAQTRPTLIDLFVAALAGFAGGLAMIDERISPALPGVAIATALNPPIAAIGLCLASGAYAGAWGAFLLFSANVLAILMVASVLFVIAGFVTRADIGSLRSLARRFAGAAIGLLLIAGVLTNYLIGVVRHVRTERTIRAALDEGLSHETNSALVGLEFGRGADGLDVLSTIRTPRVLAPETVKRLQDVLSERLTEPVRLFMRCVVTQDISATGSTSLRPSLSLDGQVASAPLAPAMRLREQAEQVAREVAATRPGMALSDVGLIEVAGQPVIVISIESTREPRRDEVAGFETLLRQRLGEPHLRVVVRRTVSTDVTAKGRVLLGEAHFGAASEADEARRRAAESAVRTALEALPDMFAPAVDAVWRDGAWTVRAEVVGPRALQPAEVRTVEARSREALGADVHLTVWTRAELQVTAERFAPLGAAKEP